jgi:hypothetical protein
VPHASTSRRRDQAHVAAPPLIDIAARSIVLTLGVGALVLTLLARVAHAQTAPTPPAPTIGAALSHLADRHGLWGSVGLGRGSAGLDCDACAPGSTYAYVGHGTIGIRLSSRVLIGAETFAWMNVVGGGVDRIARGSYLVGRTYLFGRSPLFLHGGLGVASYTINDGALGFRTRSPSASLAAGYDWRLRGVTVSPQIAAVASTGGALHSSRTENPIAERARLGLLRTSLALSWYRR